MTHKIKIQTKEIEYTTQKVLLSAPEAYKDGYEGTTLEIPEFNKGGYITISSANNPGTTYSFFVNDSEKGITLYSRSVSVNDIGDRFYWAIEITEELSNVSLFFPNNVYDILNDFCVIYNQNQIVTDYIYYEEQENATITEIKDFKATDIIISTDTEVKTVTFTEPDTKEVAIMSTNGAVAITADNTDTNIVVEYNRDIIKAITALENAVGLVNTTLASVVDVEE